MKKGQMKLSFGMIFSIILIIVFIGFAFYAIKTFLVLQDSTGVGTFIGDLQSDINKVWKSSQASQEETYSLPSGIQYVCFTDFFSSEGKGAKEDLYEELKDTFFGNENTVFYPIGSSDFDSTEMDHIDIEKITEEENPFCIENNGEISIRLQKDFGDALVTITR